MLAKKYRTPIQKFPRNAKTAYRGKFFVVKKAANNLSYSRVGAIVPKGASSIAPRRNKIRRIIMREFSENKNVVSKPGTDYIVIINSSTKLNAGDYGALRDELKKTLVNIKK